MCEECKEREKPRRLTSAEYRAKHAGQLEWKRAVSDKFKKANMWSVANKLDACCENEDLVCCRDCGSHWWVLHHCDQRVCPVCAARVAIRRSKNMEALAATAKAPKMLTLTMPRWREDARKGIRKLREAINELRKTNVLATAKAGAYTIELVKKPDGWHIHAHCIVDCDYIPIKKLIGAWSKCIQHRGAHVRVQGASAKAVQHYICKYATKSGSDGLPLDDIVEWWQAIKGSRLWATWGAWYGKHAAEVVAQAMAMREQAECPYCGARGSIFFAISGKAVWGDDWQFVRKFYTDDSDCERRYQDEPPRREEDDFSLAAVGLE